MPGPPIRTDIVEVYVFRRGDATACGGVSFLQLRRAVEPMVGGWHPVMGHVEAGETAVEAAVRELAEEAGLDARDTEQTLGLWQLESVNTFYMARGDTVVMSPGFAVQASAGWEPTLDATHDAHRWVGRGHAGRMFMWPGQRAAVAQVAGILLSTDPADRRAADWLRIDPVPPAR